MALRANYTPFEKPKLVLRKGSRTKQQFKDECDINNIMKKFAKTGVLPDLIKKDPHYADFSEPIQYQDAMNLVIHANAQFEALSAKVRERFNNSPQKFLEFATDASNAEEMVRLGLAIKRPATPPPKRKSEGYGRGFLF